MSWSPASPGRAVLRASWATYRASDGLEQSLQGVRVTAVGSYRRLSVLLGADEGPVKAVSGFGGELSKERALSAAVALSEGVHLVDFGVVVGQLLHEVRKGKPSKIVVSGQVGELAGGGQKLVFLNIWMVRI